MEITVLCKVVDNFGDIGVVWRMCRQLRKKYPQVILNLIVDDLVSFNNIWQNVNTEKENQIVDGINVYSWNAYDFCYSAFGKENQNKLQIILECFQCGRPDWMEKILFEEDLNHTVQIIMIDYLTAEPYAESFHKLQSLTRKAKVQKVNFMPGFTNKTGSLVIDEPWNKINLEKEKGAILFFTYQKSEVFWHSVFSAFVKAKINKTIYIAKGKGYQSFVDSYNSYFDKDKLNVQELDYLSQNEWDEMMQSCSILFIRGEETMSRACLAGKPFVWHAYPQSDEYQLVKMNALLDRMTLQIDEEKMKIVRRVWDVFNTPENQLVQKEIENSVYEFLMNSEKMKKDFISFSESLFENGDLVDNLMTFIKEKCIID